MKRPIDESKLLPSDYSREGARAPREEGDLSHAARSHATVVAIATAFSFVCKRARSVCEEGDFSGATRVARLMALAAGCCCTLGCGSPEPQSGTNTNWACTIDLDCEKVSPSATCEEGRCIAKPVLPEASVPATQPDSRVRISGSLTGIAATDTGWIVVGYENNPPNNLPLAFTSTDTEHWTAEDVPDTFGGLSDVAFGNGTIVAIGSTGYIVTKPPGDRWQGVGAGANVNRVVFANDRFMATAGVEQGSGTSTDGLNWTRSGLGAQWHGYIDGQFVAFHRWPGVLTYPETIGFRSSWDGSSWTDPEGTPGLIGVRILANVGAKIFGLGWANVDAGQLEVALSAPHGTPRDKIELAPSFLASLPDSDQPTNIVADPHRVILMSRSRLRTTQLPVGAEGWVTDSLSGWEWFDMSYANQVFVAVGSHDGHPSVATSTDGLNWQEVEI